MDKSQGRDETARLPPGQNLIRSPHNWPVVGEAAALASDEPWVIRRTGLGMAAEWSLDELRARPQITTRMDIHCVTRWSKFDMLFTGLPLVELLGDDPAPFVRFIARSSRHHDSCLPRTALTEAMVVFAANGVPLAPEHGGPVRLVVPGRYFYKSVKWLSTIELRATDHLGYWESGPGYHNNADPWAEERYVTGNIPPDLRARMIERRDLGKRDLLGVDFSGEGMAGLNAISATLRNVRFVRADLTGARFDGANLSNAHLKAARLCAASFRGADVEGADFSGADLRGADFTGASLFGASFCAPDGTDGALIDATTRLSNDQIDRLADDQAAYVRARLSSTRL